MRYEDRCRKPGCVRVPRARVSMHTKPTQQSYSLFEILPSVHYIENIQSAQFSKIWAIRKLTEYPFQMCRPLLHQSYGLGMTGSKCIFANDDMSGHR
jgi:hypothetical protein